MGAHFGGTVTHGDSYLTEYAPGPLKLLLGGSDAPRAPASSASAPTPKSSEPLVFEDVVRPLLAKYCVECHGPKKQKGKLRLDSLEAMLKGGEGGPAAVAGSSATSELVKRVKLPADDDDRMPPEGKPGPTLEDLAVIAFWIDRGASPTLRVRDTLAPADGRKLLEAALAKAPSVPGAVTSVAPRGRREGAGGLRRENLERKLPRIRLRRRKPTPNANEHGSAKDAEPAAEETRRPENQQAVACEERDPGRVSAERPGGARRTLREVPRLLEEKRRPSRRLARSAARGRGERPRHRSRRSRRERNRAPRAVAACDEGSHAAEEGAAAKRRRNLGTRRVGSRAFETRGVRQRQKPVQTVSKAETSPPAASPESPPTSEPASGSEDSAESDETSVVPNTGRSVDASSPGDSSNDDAPADAELLARVPERIVLYEQAVRPLLATRCGKCHSGAKPAARLRVDDYAALVEGGLSGPGIVPGKPDESFVVQRIGLPASHDDHMPPEGEPPMTADEIALVRFWILRGAARELALPSKDVPASPLRAAAEYVPKGAESPPLRADAGCAACAIGRSNGSANALALALLAFGLFVARRRTRGASS